MNVPRKYAYVPIVGALLYGITTPLGIAVGLGIRKSYNPGSTTASIVSGVLDALSAGILLYTGLVEVGFFCFPEFFWVCADGGVVVDGA
jgi:zinc transporter 1/2/3